MVDMSGVVLAGLTAAQKCKVVVYMITDHLSCGSTMTHFSVECCIIDSTPFNLTLFNCRPRSRHRLSVAVPWSPDYPLFPPSLSSRNDDCLFAASALAKSTSGVPSRALTNFDG
jgi:hypothetical protein